MEKKEILVSASILAADLANLEKELKSLQFCGVDMVHIDVMDGVFVDNISYGNNVVAAIRPHSALCFDTHLMVINPLPLVPLFAKAGSDLLTFHIESKCDIKTCINEIHANKMKAGLALKPFTAVEECFEFLDMLEMVLIMTVEPGYGGQGFIPETLEKIEKLHKEITKRNLNVDIQVDGGINAETASLVKKAGANVLVAGTYLFKAENMADAVNSLR